MNRILNRFIALALLPCLTVQPQLAEARSPLSFLSQPLPLFAQQALQPRGVAYPSSMTRHQAGFTRRALFQFLALGGAGLALGGPAGADYLIHEPTPQALWKPGSTIALSDGRIMGYNRYNPGQGIPVVYFPSFPSSRLEQPLGAEDIVKQAGVDFVAIDPPGIGLSSPHPGAQVIDIAADVEQLANVLGFNQLILLGHSLGGALAAASAKALGSRVLATGLVSSFGPVDQPSQRQFYSADDNSTWSLVVNHPNIAALGMWWKVRRKVLNDWPAHYRDLLDGMAPDDQRLLQLPGISDLIKAARIEALRQGMLPVVESLQKVFTSWGFSLRDIQALTYLWHGEEDKRVPIGVGRLVAEAIPDCISTFLPGRGHNFIIEMLPQILDTLTSPHLILPLPFSSQGLPKRIRLKTGQTVQEALAQLPPFDESRYTYEVNQWTGALSDVKKAEWTHVRLKRGDQLFVTPRISGASTDDHLLLTEAPSSVTALLESLRTPSGIKASDAVAIGKGLKKERSPLLLDFYRAIWKELPGQFNIGFNLASILADFQLYSEAVEILLQLRETLETYQSTGSHSNIVAEQLPRVNQLLAIPPIWVYQKLAEALRLDPHMGLDELEALTAYYRDASRVRRYLSIRSRSRAFHRSP